ncbi:glycoside hydrolase family 57 protein [Paenibacillus hexagrammi]|uniref:Glycoside hydrolase family 57 N-terminal domain-containing protein n=1 Tax=Paenibacillus hexagrammi TaxID=2908839 RepID=A0ABY3SME2_9BACL|nr:hypothetical protein [Paenibacillus sp. YPD9-1]UJF34389.1 hypothetical protein L0M14_04060 [Paenibacillus sp. YPD9-1]
MRRHLVRLSELADREVLRVWGDPNFTPPAAMYQVRYKRLLQFYSRIEGDLIAKLRSLRDAGCIELITCTATHAFLPLIKNTAALRAQLETAVTEFRRYFGSSPAGIWLPECGYTPALEPHLQELGLRYFVVDAHAHACARLSAGAGMRASSGSDEEPGTDANANACAALRAGTGSSSDDEPGTDANADACAALRAGTGMRASSSSDDEPGTDANADACAALRAGTGMRASSSSDDGAGATGSVGPLLTGKPLRTPGGACAFARDSEASAQVWSAEIGYPSDGDYRDYYRDIGYDLGSEGGAEWDYIKPYVLPDGKRIHTGFKYYRVTGPGVPGDAKAPYRPDAAALKAQQHAEHFIAARAEQLRRLAAQSGGAEAPVIVCPYDAELFGHWWHEGPQWLEAVLRGLAATRSRTTGVVVETTTLGSYAAAYPADHRSGASGVELGPRRLRGSLAPAAEPVGAPSAA